MSSRKFKSFNGTFETALSTLSELEELANECREIVDNASEGLSQTQRIQTLGETADALESVETSVDIPDSLTDEVVDWTEQEPQRRNRGLSRASRRDNAIAGAQAVAERCREIENEDDPDEPEQGADETDEAFQARMAEYEEEDKQLADKKSDATALADELENLIGEVEGLEFPGMYG
jgi:adenylate kinase family enzyme